MLLEVKSNQKGYQKAKKQLFDGKDRLEELLAAIGMKTTLWKYIGVFYAQIPDKLPLFKCKKCSNFAIIGEDCIHENLKIIEDEVDKLQENWNPADHINEFVDIATHLLFIAQGDPRAPVTRSNVVDKTVKHVERASKLEYIFHWTPDQLSLVQALELYYVLIDAFYSTGKTEVLKCYGKKTREKGELLHYFNHRPIKMKGNLNLLPFTLMLQGEFPEGVVKETTFQFGIDSVEAFLQEHRIEPDHHVIFDEVICTKYTIAFVDSLVEMKNSVRSLWIAMGAEPVIGKKQVVAKKLNMNSYIKFFCRSSLYHYSIGK